MMAKREWFVKRESTHFILHIKNNIGVVRYPIV